MNPFIVAEVSSNHLGSLERALRLVEAASVAGADAVKFQTFSPEQMVDPDVVIKRGPWAGRNALELYREAHTPREWHEQLFDRAAKMELDAFSSVFHPDDVEFLEHLGCPRYKSSSCELTDTDLNKIDASMKKPIVISTGMATMDEIRIARMVAVTSAHGECDLTLLKCTSAYPANVEDANLAGMLELRKLCKAGVSDHTLGITVPGAATALGACMIEKHLTLSRADGGLDSGFSMEPHEFAEMVIHVRQVARSLGEARFGPTASELAHVGLRRRPGGKRGS